ncbi:hypothetical protein AGR56_07740 [Clostridium sp. DMHC 10]|nr:hypothetical protein AGR56_07740 [Clostridium sp. DMHC 10]
MGKVYDIMNRLTNDKPVIKIDNEHEYAVNNSKNQAIFITQLAKDEKLNDFERMDRVIEAALGKDALDYINGLNLSVKATGTIINAIMAAISEMELEDIEKEAAKQAKNFRR